MTVVRLFPRGRTQQHAAAQTDTSSADAHPRSRSLPAGRLDPRRHRWLAAGVGALLVASVGLQAVTAWAADEDELKDRRGSVGNKLRSAKHEFRHSSRQLVRAARRLGAAEARLSKAEAHLSRTRVLLDEAIKLDQTMQARLEEAKARLAEARADLAEGARELAEQRDQLAGFAADSFQSADNRLLELRVFLNAESPETLTTQMGAVDSVSNKHRVRLAHLRASEVLLKVNEDEVEAAKLEVAEQRAAAARNLERKKQLEAEAQAAEKRVSELVAARASARREAAAAKQADLRQVEQLERERERIQNKLAKLARQRRAAIARQQAREARRRASRSSSRSSSGSSGSSGALLDPVNSYITSSYGMRYHPILHYRKLHDGTDFGAGCGTPVRAAAGGRVLSVYYNAGYGNRVIIDHGIERGVSLSTSYNHLSSFSTYSGQRVRRGDIIGYVGTTGYSTGCHLHFMVYENGGTANPMGWL